jgi:translation initiation factor 3 subunit H
MSAREFGSTATANAEVTTKEVIPPIREVVIDGLTAMRIVKHCNENAPTMVAGSLLGIDLDGVLEVTYSFSFPIPKTDGEGSSGDAVEDLEGGEYQIEMMKMLRDVNIDNNCVGWYQSTFMGTVCTSDVVNYQYSYQSSEELSENSIVIMYDPTLSKKGDIVLKAFRLSKEYMNLKKNKLNKFIKPSEIMEELPLTIRSEGLSAAFLRCLSDTHEQAIDCDFDALSMQDSENFLEKHVELIGSWVDYIVSEQHRFQQHVRSNSKARQENLRTMRERLQHARDNDLDPLKVRFDNTPGLKSIDVANRNDHLLMLAQLDKYCKQLNEHIGTTIHKLNATSHVNQN